MLVAGGDRVGRNETIVRHVGGAAFDASTGEIDGSAFDRTPKDVDGLSVNRRGLFDAGNDERDRAEICRLVGARRKLGATSIFVEVKVGAMLDALAEFEANIEVVADPLESDAERQWPANPAHALIVGLPFKGESIGSLKSEMASDRIRQQVQGRFSANPK